MKTFLIYKFTSPSGKAYIGITSNTLQWRLSKHLYDCKTNAYNSLFHKAIKKYGIEAFTSEILVENVPHYMIGPFEKYWINYYDTFNNGYNCTQGGEGMQGFIPNEETREKMRQAKLGISASEETKKKMSITRSGLKNTSAIAVNVYNYTTNELVAENVCLRQWCKERNYQDNNLRNTLKGKRKHAHNLYAKYYKEQHGTPI